MLACQLCCQGLCRSPVNAQHCINKSSKGSSRNRSTGQLANALSKMHKAHVSGAVMHACHARVMIASSLVFAETWGMAWCSWLRMLAGSTHVGAEQCTLLIPPCQARISLALQVVGGVNAVPGRRQRSGGRLTMKAWIRGTIGRLQALARLFARPQKSGQDGRLSYG